MTTRLGLAALVVLGLAGVTVLSQAGPAVLVRPAWVADGVPDAVWMAVEKAITETNKGRAKALLKGAEVEARAAVVGHEDEIGRRFALAVVLGLQADREGGKAKVAIATQLKKEIEAILALDPEHGRARHLRGRLHAGVLRMSRLTRWLATSLLGGGELKKATWADAENDLVFAKVQVPEVSDHHLQFARLYRDTKRPQQALAEIEHVVAMPIETAREKAVHAEALSLRRSIR